MRERTLSFMHFLLILICSIFATSAIAEKPGKKDQKYHVEHTDYRHNTGKNISLDVSLGFGERGRVIVRDYYRSEFSQGHCPPGLARKRNGCMPPGQAKKWRKGYPLPGDVVYYDLPHRLVVELGVPPDGYKYVRVAADILMIAVGTAIVVDAIDDLSHL